MSIPSVPIIRVFHQGEVCNGALINVYQSGTTTPVATYSDGALTQPNSNPVVCNSNGEAKIYTGNNVPLRFAITTSGGTLINDIDPVYPLDFTGALAVFIGDSGAGGTKGLVPAPAAGDAAAGKFLSADGSWQQPASVTGYTNPIINGLCEVNLRPTASLSAVRQFGSTDRFTVWVPTGTPTAGTITNGAMAASRSGQALLVSGVSISGTGMLVANHRIESKDSVQLRNKVISVQVRVQHNVGLDVPYRIRLRTPTVADNYTATTIIGTTPDVQVPSGTDTVLKFEGVALGDVSNGLEIEVQSSCGTITTKNFSFSDWQIDEATVCQAVRSAPYNQEVARCQNYWRSGRASCFGYGVSGVNAGYTVNYGTSMRAAPTITLSSVSTSNAGTPAVSSPGINDFNIISVVAGTGGFSFSCAYAANAEI